MIGGDAMKFVQRIVRDDGGVHLYFRKTGHPRHALRSPWGSPELEAEVAAILKAETPQKALPGTLAGAVRAYELESANFKGLEDSTKTLYRALMYELAADFGRLPVERFTAAYILELRDIWANRGHVAANHRLQVLKNILWPSVVAADKGDPFALVPQVRRPHNLTEPNPIWPDQVVTAAIEEAIAQRKFGLARAVILARWTGARRGDLVKMTPKVLQEGRVRFLSGKRNVPVDVMQDEELIAWLARTPGQPPQEARRGRKLKPGAPTRLRPARLVYNLAGDPYTEDGLALELGKLLVGLAKRQVIDGAELDEEGTIVGSIYGLHGLRHSRGVEVALSGVTDAEGAAMMGHKSPNSFAQYRRQADRKRLSDAGSAKVTLMREHRANANV